ncbi:MAG TPA: hypothetical protein VMR52_04280 [Dehalococcoidia bacterium]|nr:hypothetical protein [Dehalococcoidia bacterium]
MKSTRLDIYVELGCMGCQRAAELADWVRDRFPLVNVRVLNPHEDASDQAAQVRATPTYFLNGVEFSLGNPSQEQLEAALMSIQESTA